MAGAGFKTFNTGDVLTASDVNTYLMQQTVMVFADASARTTALGANVAEGMLSYLKDTDVVEVYNGSAWVSSDDPNAIQNTIVDAKGDIITATAADTPARLAVGANGYTLVADSSASTGLAYGSSALVNPVINGAADIWQRGTSIAYTGSAAGAYNADRWFLGGTNANQACTISRQVTNDTTNLPNIQYCIRAQKNNGQTGNGALSIGQSFESVNSIPFAGKSITFSFYARAGANYSPTSSALTYKVITGTGTDQNVLVTGYTGSADTISGTATLTTTWQRFTATATIPAATTEIGVVFSWTTTGTAGAADYFEVTGVQIDLGSTALPFRRSGGTIQEELTACQRYYWRSSANVNNNQVYGGGFAPSTTAVLAPFSLPVQMRSVPTIIGYANVQVTDETNNFTPSNLVANSRTSVNVLQIQPTITGATQFRPYLVVASAANSYIDASAEL